MKRSVLIRPRARQDIIDQAVYIATDNPAAADRFEDAVRAAVEHIVDKPGIGFVYNFSDMSRPSVRIWPVGGFRKHLIFYHAETNVVEIVRVLHASREIESILDLNE